jgi:hypothetical protein
LKAATSRKRKYKDKNQVNVNEARHENMNRLIWLSIVYRQKENELDTKRTILWKLEIFRDKCRPFTKRYDV